MFPLGQREKHACDAAHRREKTPAHFQDLRPTTRCDMCTPIRRVFIHVLVLKPACASPTRIKREPIVRRSTHKGGVGLKKALPCLEFWLGGGSRAPVGVLDLFVGRGLVDGRALLLFGAHVQRGGVSWVCVCFEVTMTAMQGNWSIPVCKKPTSQDFEDLKTTKDERRENRF